MTEYIELEALLEALGYDPAKKADVMPGSTFDIILNHPVSDVAPVVRCRDCVHWLNEDGLDDHVCLKIYSDGAVNPYAWQFREPNDFCSYGECKEVEHG